MESFVMLIMLCLLLAHNILLQVRMFNQQQTINRELRDREHEQYQRVQYPVGSALDEAST